jgi:hypothetical protein
MDDIISTIGYYYPCFHSTNLVTYIIASELMEC